MTAAEKAAIPSDRYGIDPSAVLGKRILVTGDVNTGKTTLSRSILAGLCVQGFSSRVAIVDMAPEIPSEIAARRGLTGIGGKLLPEGTTDALYLGGTTRPPRLSSRTEEEALVIAAENMRFIDGLLDSFAGSGRDILFLNDVSMYLQAGSASALLGRIAAAATVVANGYMGRRLGTGILSDHESREMRRLAAGFAIHLHLADTGS